MYPQCHVTYDVNYAMYCAITVIECGSLDDFSLSQGYYRRAEAVKRALYSGESPGLTFSDVIADYSESYRKRQNDSAICEAVIVAVNQSKPRLKSRMATNARILIYVGWLPMHVF